MKLYNEVSIYRETISVLLYADAELSELIKCYPDEAFIEKATILVHTTLRNLQYEFRHAIPPAKPIAYIAQYRWSNNVVDLVELIYALVENRSIEYGNVKVSELASYLGTILGVDVQNCHDTYTSTIKRRKSVSRTFLLDRLSFVLNKKMNIEDGCETPVSPQNMERDLFDM